MKILFAGYAPVHFRCFQPLFDRLKYRQDVQLSVSGGLRTPTADGYDYDAPALYDGFDLPEGTVKTVEEIRDLDYDVQFSAHTKLILPRKVDRTIQIFHGISFRNKAVRSANMGCDHYFMVGPYMLSRFVEAGYLDEQDSRIAQIGFMKTDPLLDSSLDREAIRSQLGFSGERPVVLYAPTGAKKNSLETMGKAVIKKLKATGRYDLVIKPHDHPKNKKVTWATYLQRYADNHCRIVPPEDDVIPMLYAADLLISDASSVANEFALLDRPIVFLDTPELLRKARLAVDSALDLNTFGRRGGVVANGPEDVVSAVDESLATPDRRSAMRRSMVREFFYNPGKATDAAMTWLDANLFGETQRSKPASLPCSSAPPQT